MKKIAIVLLAIAFIGCSKEDKEDLPTPVTPVVQVGGILHQEINGDVVTDFSYQLRVFEDMGDGNFQETINNQYKLNVFPRVFEDNIERPFYFELTLHNSSVYSTGGQGVVNATIKYKGNLVKLLEADIFTYSQTFTSAIYNN